MCFCRNKKTWTGTNTFTRIEAQRTKGGRVSGGGDVFSELHRQNTSDMITEKACSKCKEVKPLDLFSTDRKMKLGRKSWCIKCTTENAKRWANKNRDKVNGYKKDSYKRSPDRAKERAKCWRERNPEKSRENGAEWRKRNPERNKEIKKRAAERVRSDTALYEKQKLRYREKTNKATLQLSDSYVRSNLVHCGFNIETVKQHPELIEIKRLIIKTKRL